MTTINAATYIGDSVLFLRDYLRTNITDPISRTTGSNEFVMTSFPKIITQYPLIVLRNTGNTTTKLGMQSTINQVVPKYEIKIFSKNSKQCDSLTQSIIDTLRIAQYATSGTGINQLYGFKLDNTVPIVDPTGDNTIHQKVLTFTYLVILQ